MQSQDTVPKSVYEMNQKKADTCVPARKSHQVMTKSVLEKVNLLLFSQSEI